MKGDRYIIECRDPRGRLDFARPQPEDVFGLRAITGITEDDLAKAIFAKLPQACLDGGRIPSWPMLLDLRWTARRKTW
jgi:hypothetical protein